MILCDVSDSVRNVSRFMLQFVYSLQDLYSKVRSFIFVAEIGEITDHFRDNDIKDALDIALRGDLINVYAHSNFGYAFRTFAQDHIGVINKKTTVIVLGDGRNNYNLPHDWCLREIRSRAKQLIWLNPESKQYLGLWRQRDGALRRRTAISWRNAVTSISSITLSTASCRVDRAFEFDRRGLVDHRLRVWSTMGLRTVAISQMVLRDRRRRELILRGKPMAGHREEFILMTVGALTLDPNTKTPIVVLKDPDNKINLPIWIGLLEAASMATELEGIKPQRPMTHDLLRNMLGELGGTVEAVEVTELRDNTYFAHIQVKTREGGWCRSIPRPSDAISLALRTKSPIYVAKKVLEVSSELQQSAEADSKEQNLAGVCARQMV